MPKLAWIVALALVVTAAIFRKRLHASLRRVSDNVHDFDLPSAGLYDALVGSILEPFYARVAREVTAARSGGALLEVGSGPGRLAVCLVRSAPRLDITGVDISPGMVERAARRVAEAGLASRVRFVAGDVGVLPFPDASFDAVVSTLSLHHWPDPARGLAEIHRVLGPGGEAMIYDLAGWLWPPASDERRLLELAAGSPFRGGTVEEVRWPGGVPAFALLRLQRS